MVKVDRVLETDSYFASMQYEKYPMWTSMSIGTPSRAEAVLRLTNGRAAEAMETRKKSLLS